FVVRLVPRLLLDMQIRDGDELETLLAEVANHAFEVRESLAVDGERGIALLVIDVEVENVGGNFVFAESARDFQDPGLRKVAVPRLLETECPERRQGHVPNQRSVGLQNFLGIGTEKKVVVQLAAFGSEGVSVAGGASEVEAAAPGVVEKDAIRGSVPHGEEDDAQWRFLDAHFAAYGGELDCPGGVGHLDGWR